jgi:hypothetical protein
MHSAGPVVQVVGDGVELVMAEHAQVGSHLVDVSRLLGWQPRTYTTDMAVRVALEDNLLDSAEDVFDRPLCGADLTDRSRAERQSVRKLPWESREHCRVVQLSGCVHTICTRRVIVD